MYAKLQYMLFTHVPNARERCTLHALRFMLVRLHLLRAPKQHLYYRFCVEVRAVKSEKLQQAHMFFNHKCATHFEDVQYVLHNL